MYEPKKDIYTMLSSLEDVTVYQARPEVITTFPCITFYVTGNTPEYTLDDGIGSQAIEVVIDIYANTSIESGELLVALESKMLENGYRMVFGSDVPEDTKSHITTRFNLSY